MARILLALVALAVAFVMAIAAASEFGGEGVTLYTKDAGGVEKSTSLWVVDYGGSQYLRAGNRDSAWVERLRRNPEVRLERGGRTATYQAVPAPDLTPKIDELMAGKYGLADSFVGLIRDPSKSLAVRLAPSSP
jgi:hypothetical protein